MPRSVHARVQLMTRHLLEVEQLVHRPSHFTQVSSVNVSARATTTAVSSRMGGPALQISCACIFGFACGQFPHAKPFVLTTYFIEVDTTSQTKPFLKLLLLRKEIKGQDWMATFLDENHQQ